MNNNNIDQETSAKILNDMKYKYQEYIQSLSNNKNISLIEIIKNIPKIVANEFLVSKEEYENMSKVFNPLLLKIDDKSEFENEEENSKNEKIKNMFINGTFKEVLETIILNTYESISLKINITKNKNLSKNQIKFCFEAIFHVLMRKEKYTIHDVNELSNIESFINSLKNNNNLEEIINILQECKNGEIFGNKLKNHHEKSIAFLFHYYKFKTNTNGFYEDIKKEIVLELLKTEYKEIVCYKYPNIVKDYIFGLEDYLDSDYNIIYCEFFLYNTKNGIVLNDQLLYSLNLLHLTIIGSKYFNFLSNIYNKYLTNKYSTTFEKMVDNMNIKNENLKKLHILYIYMYGDKYQIQYLRNKLPYENYNIFKDIYNFRFSKQN